MAGFINILLQKCIHDEAFLEELWLLDYLDWIQRLLEWDLELWYCRMTKPAFTAIVTNINERSLMFIRNQWGNTIIH